MNKPNSAALRKINGEFITWLEENKLDDSHPLTPFLTDLAKPEYGTITAKDGQVMHYRLFKPTNMAKGKSTQLLLTCMAALMLSE